MTATTTLPTTVGAGSVHSALRMAAVLVLLAVLLVASFAFGRGTADTTPMIRTSSSAPAPICGSAFHEPLC
ncbi:MAG: hypothetical protein ABIY48_08025 [Acidimicrobiales bacterium]